MRLLISQGFLGTKAPLQSGFAKDTVFLSAKTQSCKKLRFLRYSAKQNSWIVCRFLVCTAFAALVKQGKTYFLKSSQTSRERRAFASGNSCFISSPVQKLKNSAKQNSWTVCRFPVLPTPCAKTAKSYAFCVIRRSRILGLYAGSRFGMFFRLWNRRSD